MRPTDYSSFINQKRQIDGEHGFKPNFLPDWMFDFQKHLVEWAVRKGRSAIFADCGLGKTPMQLVWAENIVRHNNHPVLILTPLAVANQTQREAEKFGIEARKSSGEIASNIVVANYEKLHHFNPEDFCGVVCDESSILKSFSGQTRKDVTRFMSKIPYRLLCTATAAPNDYTELGNSSEALGELNYSEMLKRFFRQLDDKGQKSEIRQQEIAEAIVKSDPNYFKKLAYRVSQTIGQWRLKHHAITPFWRWVSSWARACRMPSDLGFNDGDFVLPELTEFDHVISPKTPRDGMLFNIPAFGLSEEREERKRTLVERTDFAASLVNHNKPAVIWCHMNQEADRLEEIIPDAKQIAGSTPDEKKIELYDAFASKQLRVLIIKPKIGAWGLNWQHCNHVVTFATHSYEQHYQSVRRCWRFGQKKPVRVDVICTSGESRVIANLKSKADKADKMFDAMVREMNQATRIERHNEYTGKVAVPSWL